MLIQNRPDTLEVFGGDSVQTLKTAEYLRKLGVHVDISFELTPKLEGYDIVHLMNITRVKFTYVQLANAKKQGKKVVLSPIYWNTKQVIAAYLQTPVFDLNGLSFKELARACFSSLIKKRLLNEIGEVIQNRKLASEVLSKTDCLLPNSGAELEILKRDFAEAFRNEEKKSGIVPNGVDAGIFYSASPREFIEKHGLDDFILNVGRFSYRKNQFALIKALRGLGMKVVFIGGSPDSSSNYYRVKNTIDKIYYQKCRRDASSSLVFLPAMPQKQLASAYAACKTFVLPSLYETPGLSALEAALAGANICVTSGGSTREYFSNLASYCDPYNANSIRKAVLEAYHHPKDNVLKKHVLMNFTWDKTAKATLEAYMAVLEK